jgi:hypothetical protein
MGYASDSAAQPQEDSHPLLQILDVGSGKTQKQNYELPIHPADSNQKFGYPLFNGSRDKYLARLTDEGSDVGEYSLYKLDLAEAKGSIWAGPLSLAFPLRVSPDGRRSAYYTEEFHSGVEPRLQATIDEKTKEVARDRAAIDFSWSQQASLVYAILSPDSGEENQTSKETGVYENDLRGNITKLGPFMEKPALSRDRRHIAFLSRHREPTNSQRDDRWGFSIFNTRTKRSKIVRSIDDKNAHLFWNQKGDKAYVVENYYVYAELMAYCRISVYDVATQKSSVLCTLRQNGESTFEDSEEPYFTTVAIANRKYLLLQVRATVSGEQNYHVLAVDLATGSRTDLLSFTGGRNIYRVPLVDWIDAPA